MNIFAQNHSNHHLGYEPTNPSPGYVPNPQLATKNYVTPS